jgi:SNF2 family DNA or RNA helicase
MPHYLLRVRIAHVTAFSLRPSVSHGIISFHPVAMRRIDPDDLTRGAELVMSPAAGELFAQEFTLQPDVNSTYALQSGQYVYIDPSVRTALRVVKQKQRAPIEERLAFLMSPARVISEAYAQSDKDENDVPIGETIFFETSQFSERVSGIGEWIPPQLSYLEKHQNNWLPERFSIVLAERLVTGKPDDVPNWIEQVEFALAAKQAEVEIGGVTIPTDTPGLLATLQRIQPPERMPDEKGSPGEFGGEVRNRRRITILQTKSNFDVDEYKKSFNSRRLQDISIPPMRVGLKAHQQEGVLWLVSCYVAGWPGVLLADDMGLGKTLQSLTFLALLRREGVIRNGRPALIVAPTSLLRNWQDEHKKHMLGEGLGAPLVAFGHELRNLKLGHASSDGVQLLDTTQMAANTWVLTTYESIRDYHFSFAKIPFSVAVLDEIQKAKNRLLVLTQRCDHSL